MKLKSHWSFCYSFIACGIDTAMDSKNVLKKLFQDLIKVHSLEHYGLMWSKRYTHKKK